MTVREIDSFIKFIENFISKEENHLDWLYQKRIDLVNNRKQYLHVCKIEGLNYTVDEDVEEMINISESHLSHFKYRLIEYIKYRNDMINM